jgi:hypothetical protein
MNKYKANRESDEKVRRKLNDAKRKSRKESLGESPQKRRAQNQEKTLENL